MDSKSVLTITSETGKYIGTVSKGPSNVYLLHVKHKNRTSQKLFRDIENAYKTTFNSSDYEEKKRFISSAPYEITFAKRNEIGWYSYSHDMRELVHEFDSMFAWLDT